MSNHTEIKTGDYLTFKYDSLQISSVSTESDSYLLNGYSFVKNFQTVLLPFEAILEGVTKDYFYTKKEETSYTYRDPDTGTQYDVHEFIGSSGRCRYYPDSFIDEGKYYLIPPTLFWANAYISEEQLTKFPIRQVEKLYYDNRITTKIGEEIPGKDFEIIVYELILDGVSIDYLQIDADLANKLIFTDARLLVSATINGHWTILPWHHFNI